MEVVFCWISQLSVERIKIQKVSWQDEWVRLSSFNECLHFMELHSDNDTSTFDGGIKEEEKRGCQKKNKARKRIVAVFLTK